MGFSTLAHQVIPAMEVADYRFAFACMGDCDEPCMEHAYVMEYYPKRVRIVTLVGDTGWSTEKSTEKIKSYVTRSLPTWAWILGLASLLAWAIVAVDL